MISLGFQGTPFSITVIQIYALTNNAEEVEWFYSDLQDILELTPKKRCPFHYRGLECKSRKSRDTWSNRQIGPWSTEWSRAKANRVLPRECTGHRKRPLPTTQEMTLHMDITRWPTLKSYWLYSLQPKMEKLYIVSKNKTRSCSVQLLSHVQLFATPEVQHTRPLCPSPAPRIHPSSCPLSQWCHPTISSFVVPFSFCLQSFPASGSFPMSQLFASGDQNTRVSASTSVLPMNIQNWSALGWTGWISLQSKGLSRVFSNTTVQKHQFFSAQLSL